jgi:FixJ family two-component response regulator
MENLRLMHGTVLIVDDDAGIRDTVRLVLAREGYGILTAPDGDTAMQLMAMADNSAKVCALLCDLEMPHMGGKELIEHFRKQFPEIPIIVLSGASDTVFLDGIVQGGVCDWLRKPVSRETLLDKVRTASNLFALRQQHR